MRVIYSGMFLLFPVSGVFAPLVQRIDVLGLDVSGLLSFLHDMLVVGQCD